MTQVKTVLCPYDFSDTAGAALRMALFLVERFGSRLILVHVVEPVAIPDYPIPLQVDEAVVRRRIEEEFRRAVGASFPEAPHERLPHEIVLRQGSAPVEIVRAARDCGADLIVMGTHGRTGFQHVLFGSVAERVVRAAHCPVLTVRNPAHQPPQP